MSFVGRVPNVSGRLSFQTLTKWSQCIEDCDFSDDIRAPEAPTVSNRHVGTFHRRITNDTPGRAILRALLPPFLRFRKRRWVKFFLPKDAVDYFMVAKCDDSGEVLRGTVYTLHANKIREKWARKFRHARKRTHQSGARTPAGLLQVYQDLTLEVTGLLNDYPSKQDIRVTPIRSDGNFGKLPQISSCDFILSRDGKCVLENIEVLRELGAAIDTKNMAATKKQQADDAFRFIRDLFHNHYHHNASDDGMTEVHPIDAENSWILHVDRILFRSIINARQHNKEKHINNALGRLAYLKSFRAVHRTAYETDTYKLPERRLEELEHSMRTQSISADQRAQERRFWVTGAFAIPFALLSFLMGLKAESKDVTPLIEHGEGVRYIQEAIYAWFSLNIYVFPATLIVVLTGYIMLLGQERVRHLAIAREYKRWRIATAISSGPSPKVYVLPIVVLVLFAITFVTSMSLVLKLDWAVELWDKIHRIFESAATEFKD